MTDAAAMAPPPVVVVAAAPPNQNAMRASMVMAAAMRGRHRADQDVAMQHVAELVRDHAFDLVVVHQLQDPGGERHRGVRRVAAGGEGVRRMLGDQAQLRHGQAHALAQVLHHGRRRAGRLPGSPSRVTGCARYMRARSCRRRSSWRNSSRRQARARCTGPGGRRAPLRRPAGGR